MAKNLYRSRDDRMIAGVCGGIAEYFNVDYSLIRLALVFIFLFRGIGLIAYLIAWLVISEEPRYEKSEEVEADYYLEEDEEKAAEAEEKSNKRQKLFALLLIIIGSLFLVDIWLPNIYWQRYWPIILIAAGFMLLKGDNNDR
ncbi:MAG: PspC domain-containing protein [Halanaerobium sp. MSAO_Bac5]|nr:MAG: PspC domain-containing protein [Halanaerobium sp. MSAO_Bac5]